MSLLYIYFCQCLLEVNEFVCINKRVYKIYCTRTYKHYSYLQFEQLMYSYCTVVWFLLYTQKSSDLFVQIICAMQISTIMQLVFILILQLPLSFRCTSARFRVLLIEKSHELIGSAKWPMQNTSLRFLFHPLYSTLFFRTRCKSCFSELPLRLFDSFV